MFRYRDPGVYAPGAEFEHSRTTSGDETPRTDARADAALHVLRRWDRDPTHSGYFKVGDLAEPLGLTKKQFRTAAAELERRGVIERWNPGADSPTTWYLTLDQPNDHDATTAASASD